MGVVRRAAPSPRSHTMAWTEDSSVWPKYFTLWLRWLNMSRSHSFDMRLNLQWDGNVMGEQDRLSSRRVNRHRHSSSVKNGDHARVGEWADALVLLLEVLDLLVDRVEESIHGPALLLSWRARMRSSTRNATRGRLETFALSLIHI